MCRSRGSASTSIEASEVISDSAKTGFRARNLRMVVYSMRYEVEGISEVKVLADGLMELKAEEIRMTKVPSTL